MWEILSHVARKEAWKRNERLKEANVVRNFKDHEREPTEQS